MNGRKRNYYYKRESEKRERNSDRREISPPDTSILTPLLTLPTTFSTTSLQNTYFNVHFTISYTTYSNTTIFSFRLSSSSSTDCTLEAEHVTPFSFTFGVIEIICPM